MAKEVSRASAEDLVAQVDTGGRDPKGWQKKFFLSAAFIWALFHLYIASNLPFWLTDVTSINVIIPSSEARRIHLAFAIVLAALAFPLFKRAPKDRIPWYDWLIAVLGVVACIYAIIFKNEIAVRAGLPTGGDLVISAIGMTVLGISVFRSLGLPLLIISGVFVCYVFFGSAEWLPDVIQWKGASFGKAMWHYWMQGEGVFGVAVKVSTELIFLFVLFGAILEKAGAGNYFIKLAFALLGHLRGGPAKAAVVASAMSGLYSGSSIANTVTTGTFTIPLMKRTGFSPEKAGAVEVASSTNGQLTPPVMGAAAFLIAEFTGIAYTDILKHALVPALVSYIALFYIVHIEAMKMNLQGLPKPPSSLTFARKMLGFLTGFILVTLLFGAVYFVLGAVKAAVPGLSFMTVVIIAGVAYLVLLWFAARKPDLKVDPPDAPITELPPAGPTAITGLYFALPIIILIWCILPTPDRLSPGLAAFWAVMAMTFVALTQHPIKAVMRGSGNLGTAFRQGWDEWVEGMISGSRNMISIGIATGAAGIIIGSISLTGAHQIVGEFVEFLSGGSLIVMLVLVAVMSLILGMGLPTTANYIVVSSLMAPVIVALGAKSGLIVPLIAVHLFVFYFGILADDTPPVGLAAFAAAAISGGDPIKTGLQGFAYDIRTALLPFMFIFNTELLLIDVSAPKAIFIFVIATIAMMLFASATQRWLVTRNRIWESLALLLIAFTLFRPGFWLDQVSPPYRSIEPAKVYEVVNEVPPNGRLTVIVSGPNFNTGEIESTTLLLDLGDPADAIERLTAAGLTVTVEDGQALIEEPFPGTPLFEKIGSLFDYYGDDPVQIAEVQQEADRMPKEVFYIPAFLLLGVIVFLQRRRRDKTAAAA
jgi:TRAP transporter 4TM/12TM fusion protein